MAKRRKASTLSHPTWKFKNGDKCHPMTIKNFISADMIIATLANMMYHNKFNEKDKPEYYYYKDRDDIPVEKITQKEIEYELRWNITNKGLDFFEVQYDKKGNHLWDKATQIIQLRYPKYFKNNTLDLILS